MRRLLSRRRITDSGCWEYTGALDRKGYGRVHIKGTTTRNVARIAAWLWLDFDLACELFICHRCDNRKCFNPEHLFVGTQGDNLRDASAKGRLADRLSGKWQLAITHCPQGHEYTPENTIIEHGNGRRCRKCKTDSAREAYRRAHPRRDPDGSVQ